MPRPRRRACLEHGLNLNLNHLTRRGVVRSGARTSTNALWTRNGEPMAAGWITADMTGLADGWLRLEIGDLDQKFLLVARPRHFGGRQWYFICPSTNRRVSVLWKPPGAHDFACWQRWGAQVAYASQFMTPYDRMYRGMARINSLVLDWRL